MYVKPGMWVTGDGVDEGNCVVVSVDGKTIIVTTNVTASAGSRISFTEVQVKTGTSDTWRSLINVYGSLAPGLSQIRLLSDDGVTEVVGTVAYHPGNDNLLLFSPDADTLPANTLSPISAIIDPSRSRPNADLPAPTAGTRYLLVNDYVVPAGEQPTYNWIGSDGEPLSAFTNDVIEYNGTNWVVAFDSKNSNTFEYVTNLTTGVQYKWNTTDWVKSYEGYYRAGEWSIVL
jgi:hypothetical protein